MSGTKAQQARGMLAWDSLARAEQRKPPGWLLRATACSHTLASLGVPSTADGKQRRPNLRCTPVGEASDAGRDADVTVAHANAQRHDCLGVREGTSLSSRFHFAAGCWLFARLWRRGLLFGSRGGVLPLPAPILTPVISEDHAACSW